MENIINAVILIVLTLQSFAYSKNIPTFNKYSIKIPQESKTILYSWGDFDGNSSLDLFVVTSSGKGNIFYQDSNGFSKNNSKDINFPNTTAWYAVNSIDPNSNKNEIIISTVNGVYYYEFKGGNYQLKGLIEKKQPFGTHNFLNLAQIDLKLWDPHNNDGSKRVPIFASNYIDSYLLMDGPKCKRIGAIAFKSILAAKVINNELWSAGNSDSKCLKVESNKYLDSNPTEKDAVNHTSPHINELLAEVEKRFTHGLVHCHKHPNGFEGIILWYTKDKVEPVTVFVVFKSLESEEPAQVLRFKGLPLVSLTSPQDSFLYDVDRDGYDDLISLELISKPNSASNLLEIALSQELKWKLRVNLYEKTGFADDSNIVIDIATGIDAFSKLSDVVKIVPDLNNDKFPDFVVQRQPREYDVYYSKNKMRYSSKFKDIIYVDSAAPIDFKDINGDGLLDIYQVDGENSQILIYLNKGGA